MTSWILSQGILAFKKIKKRALMRHNTVPENGFTHKPVMWNEVIRFFKEVSGIGENVIVDCTLGEGGHSELILQNFQDMKVLGIERDMDIMEIARKRLAGFGERIEYINDNFINIPMILKNYEDRISGMLFDFGISSYHYEDSCRGFSLYKNERLDMRLDDKSSYDAEYIVNKFSEKELQDIFIRFGEERWAKKIAKEICSKRNEKKIETTQELEQVVFKAIPARFRTRNIHPATRVFQAIRIAVNDELTAIEDALKNAYKFLSKGGMIIAISFHSLEDRIVKNSFKRLARGCLCTEEQFDCQCKGDKIIKIITKKPMTPQKEELEVNRRARSAKMRVCVRI